MRITYEDPGPRLASAKASEDSLASTSRSCLNMRSYALFVFFTRYSGEDGMEETAKNALAGNNITFNEFDDYNDSTQKLSCCVLSSMESYRDMPVFVDNLWA